MKKIVIVYLSFITLINGYLIYDNYKIKQKLSNQAQDILDIGYDIFTLKQNKTSEVKQINLPSNQTMRLDQLEATMNQLKRQIKDIETDVFLNRIDTSDIKYEQNKQQKELNKFTGKINNF